MKKKEAEQAKKLRRNGVSITEIARKLNVSKGSVSLWVRNVSLSEEQERKLAKQAHTKFATEKRRRSRLTKERARRDKIIQRSKEDINTISKKELFLIGTGLYWAEGSKTRRGVVEFSNSDPAMIIIMMRFFREVCKVPENRFRGHIHLHQHLNRQQAEIYWSSISHIPKEQFFQTTQQHNKASKNKKDTLPNGTFAIYVCDTALFLSIYGWILGLSSKLAKEQAKPSLREDVV